MMTHDDPIPFELTDHDQPPIDSSIRKCRHGIGTNSCDCTTDEGELLAYLQDGCVTMQVGSDGRPFKLLRLDALELAQHLVELVKGASR